MSYSYKKRKKQRERQNREFKKSKNKMTRKLMEQGYADVYARETASMLVASGCSGDEEVEVL